jgi:microcin C transport system substrate-binding protein
MRWHTRITGMILCLLSLDAYAQTGKHAIAMHGAPKYPANFAHFDYVNPNAPKGGEVVLGVVGTFDSLNPFIVRGMAASGLGLLFDTLTVKSEDEAFTEYGLLAEQIIVAEDRTSVTFILRPEARFHSGNPVRPEDVIWTFNTLREQGQPFYRAYYSAVKSVEKTGERGVTFTFTSGENRELPLIIGQMPVLSEEYYRVVLFDRTTLEPPVGSGAYQICDTREGRSITYCRDENYWGKDLAVNRGQHNFDKIRYDFYRDSTVAVEAFKAGLYDFRQEHIAKNWAEAYNIRQVKDGQLIKAEIPHELPAGMQAFVFNTRNPLFADRNVRWALNHAFDFEWTNNALFYGAYTRSDSYFANSELAATGLPEGAERALLEPYRDQLPDSLFTEAYAPPRNADRGSIRRNLITAKHLLEKAGWEQKGDTLRHKDTGQVFAFEILLVQPEFERVVAPFIQNLKRLGINATMRTVDSTQYQQRVTNFNYDMIVSSFGASLSPGNEQRAFWHSSKVDVVGSRNLIGVNNPVVDALVEKVIAAPTREELIIRTRALDRVLLWEHYVIPQWHINSHRVLYWDKFGKPDITPKYGLGFPHTWWRKQVNTAPATLENPLRP